MIRTNKLSTEGLRSKTWDEFAQPGAPVMDFVFTVCDDAAGEVCPLWPGQPVTAHWGMPDPAAVEGDDETRRRAFLRAFSELRTRIMLFANLPMEKLNQVTLQEHVDDIGKHEQPA